MSLFALIIFSILPIVNCQYEDVRCKCICPVQSVVTNSTNATSDTRRLYIKNVAPNQCNCDFVVLPQLKSDVQSKAKEFCPRCECKYESRDTSIIRFFVIFIIGVISFLAAYMVFLMILDPWMHKRSSRNIYKSFTEEVSLEPQQQQQQYPTTSSLEAHDLDNQFEQQISPQTHQRHISSAIETIESTSGTGVNVLAPKGVFNRVGYSQNKWKRQVKEQRRNIFDKHTILN